MGRIGGWSSPTLMSMTGRFLLVVARRGCQVGRVVRDPAAGLLVAELVFDQPLRRGETVITEHELVNQWPFPVATNYERKFRLPVRQYLLEVVFDVAALPSRCVKVSQGQVAEARIDPHGRVHGVALGFGPGCFGFRWEWA